MEHTRIRSLKVLLLISSLACLVFLVLAAYEENFRAEWYQHQRTYGRMLVQQAAARGGSAATPSVEIRQAYLEELGRVDRCASCHVAIDNPAFAGAPQPLAAHPGPWLDHHPADKFGCTICHQGQGRATTREEAHGRIAHWPEPMLEGDLVFTSCGRCHYEYDLYGGQSDLYGRIEPVRQVWEEELGGHLPGAERILRGKQLVVELGCLGCHKYRGRGGVLGPDLTYVGDKTVHDFDFTHVPGPHTVENWMFVHFKSPAAVVPSTVMPELGLSDEEVGDLVAYMRSLKRKSAPAAYTPVPRQVAGTPIGGDTIYAMYCSACHGPDGVGAIVRDPLAAQLIDRPREMLTPSLRNPDTLAVTSDAYLRRIIAKGRPGTSMIGWEHDGSLSDDEIDRLVAFIRGWQHASADRLAVSASRGNARYGAALYRANCAGCHGANGEGGEIGVSLRSSTFLGSMTDQMLAQTIVEGRANTAMPAWSDFENREVSDLLAYLRSWQPLQSDRDAVLASDVLDQDAPPADRIATGWKLYRSRCAVCHGDDGEGKIGPSLNNPSVLSVVTDAFLTDTIIQGRPGTAMPAWRQLTTDDVVDLVALVKSWRTSPVASLEQVHVTGDWQYGQLLYQGMCASCHGPNAEGAIGPQLINPVLLDTASDAMLVHWISYGRQGTQMRPFLRGQQGAAELSQSQIEDIVTYLRSQRGRTEVAGQQIGLGFAPRGAVLYQQMCFQCHGERGEGATGPAIGNPSFLRVASDGFLRATIVLGRQGTEMRAMGYGGAGIVELRADQIDDLIAYLRTAQTPPEIAHRFVIGASPERGAVVYEGFCAGCHGEDGRGGFAPELNNDGFLSAATDGFLQATIIRGRRGTAMRPFRIGGGGIAELSQQQINDVVAFIRQWSTDTRPLRRTEPFPLVAGDGDLGRLTSSDPRR